MQSGFIIIVCYSNSTWHISHTFRALCAIMVLAASVDWVQPHMQITLNLQQKNRQILLAYITFAM